MISANKTLQVARARLSAAIDSKDKAKSLAIALSAISMLRRLAYRGNPDAQFELGQQYEDTGFLAENPKRAYFWYIKAAKGGHAEACNSIGFYIEHGLIGRPNRSKAVSWYKKGLERGSPSAKKNYSLSKKQLLNSIRR